MVNAKAIFFDRDGVLIEAPKFKNLPKSSKNIKEIKLCRGIKKFCNYYKKRNYYLIMITNQPDFSRKRNTKKNINEINEYLKKILKLDHVYVCFSDDDKCKNRKPNPGMIISGKKKYNLNLKKSFVIGDRWKDIGAGKKAKCKTILINKNYNEKMVFKPDFKVKNLEKIYQIIN
tara:strand:- start:384 stop:905 length:522 start_codon:yes stop_codon:yes gene_type:complete